MKTITKSELEQYISIVKEVPDEIGLTPTDGYNTRYVGEWGVYAFCFLPPELAKALQAEIAENPKKMCRKLSFEHHGDHRFICNLPKGHDGLCMGASADDEIAALFDPDPEAPEDGKYIAHRMVSEIISGLIEKGMIKKILDDCDDD